jgi:DNA modification methylase
MKAYHDDELVTLYHGDSMAAISSLPDGSIDCCITSPPYYGLRDYGQEGQYGLEDSPVEYVETMRALFAEVRRVLADDGTLWLNIGDSYSSSPPGATPYADRKTTLSSKRHSPATKAMRESVRTAAIDRTKFLPEKNLMGIPWRVAFALQGDGWILRNEIIWAKPNAMPESARDRFSNRHEHLFLFAKSRRYWFTDEAFTEPGKIGNPGDVWVIPTQPFSAAHFAVYPVALAERAVLAGCRPGGTVLDPFSGSGTTGLAANKHGRKYVGVDLSADYLDLSLRTRFAQPGLDFGGVA